MFRQADRAAAETIFYDLTGLEHRQHIADGYAVVRTAVYDNNHVLADLGDTANNRNNPPFNIAAR